MPLTHQGLACWIMSVIYPAPGNKTTIYVGGFGPEIDESKLHAVFIPFGPIREVFIPRDTTTAGGHRGFGFVEYEESGDAKSAIDNMHMNEVWGDIIRCNMARPTRIVTAGVKERAVWELEAAAGGGEGEVLDEVLADNPEVEEEPIDEQ